MRKINLDEVKSIANDPFYSEAPSDIEEALVRAKVIKDFLPDPEKLVFRKV